MSLNISCIAKNCCLVLLNLSNHTAREEFGPGSPLGVAGLGEKMAEIFSLLSPTVSLTVISLLLDVTSHLRPPSKVIWPSFTARYNEKTGVGLCANCNKQQRIASSRFFSFRNFLIVCFLFIPMVNFDLKLKSYLRSYWTKSSIVSVNVVHGPFGPCASYSWPSSSFKAFRALESITIPPLLHAARCLSLSP